MTEARSEHSDGWGRNGRMPGGRCCEIEEGEKCRSVQNVEDVEEMCSGSITFDEAGIMFEDIELEFSFLLDDGNENRGKGFSWLESTGSGELDDTDCGTRF